MLNIHDNTGRRKAAIFLIALGPETAAEVMRHLGQDEVDALTLEMMRTRNVTNEEQDTVLTEFQALMMADQGLARGGRDYAFQVLMNAFGAERAEELLERLDAASGRVIFEFARKLDPEFLLNFIQNEHPQTIALVLCYLDPRKSAWVLSHLPIGIQAEVARRVSVMERISPEALDELDKVLERKARQTGDQDFAQVGGVSTTVEILNQVDRGTERTIIGALEEEDPELAESIKAQMTILDDIVAVDDGGIRQILANVDFDDLVKALKNVPADVEAKIMGNLGKRRQQMIRDEIAYMGPVRAADVEESQQKIVMIMRKLEDQGAIIIPRGDQEKVIY